MAAFSDALFWFSLTMLGVVSVVYTLSHSYVSEMRPLVEAEENVQRARYDSVCQQVTARVQRQAVTVDGLTEAVKKLKAEERQLGKRLAKLESITATLNPWKSLATPGCLFLVAYVSATLGKALAAPANGTFSDPAAAIPLLVGACLACGGLWCFGTGLRNLQQMSDLLSPLVEATFEYSSTWKRDVEETITITVRLDRARFPALHKMHVMLCVPPNTKSTAGFIEKLSFPPDDPLRPSYETIVSKTSWDLLKYLPWTYDFSRLSLSHAGKYKFYYRILSEEYTSPYYPIEITVQ